MKQNIHRYPKIFFLPFINSQSKVKPRLREEANWGYLYQQGTDGQSPDKQERPLQDAAREARGEIVPEIHGSPAWTNRHRREVRHSP